MATAAPPQLSPDLLLLTGDLSKTSPGRLGTLTADQQAKLTHLWLLLGLELNLLETTSSAKEIENYIAVLATQPTKTSLTPPSFKLVVAPTPPTVPGTNVDLRTALWTAVKHDHPDALLLRFLRARKWNPKAALGMLTKALHWRVNESKVDSDILFKGEMGAWQDSQYSGSEKQELHDKKEGGDFLDQMRKGKSFLSGRDREGRPVFVIRSRLHRAKDQSEEVLRRYATFMIETARLMLGPPVDTAVLLFDMTDFGRANMDNAPVKFMIDVFESCYPESLAIVAIHNAPWIFRGFWAIIKGWIDPVVASKIRFTATHEDLAEFLPETTIPKEIGGEQEEWKYVEPVAGENEKMSDTATKEMLLAERAEIVSRFEEATVDWINKQMLLAEGEAKVAGDKAVEEAANKRHAIAVELRSSYGKVDPYIRARSVYDRLGWINVPS